jgi:ATP-dependent protease ClpP protease subunit
MTDDRVAPGFCGEDGSRTPTSLLQDPNLRIYGSIDDSTVWYVLDRLEEIRKTDDPLVLELTTQGGDADAALRIALEIRLFRQLCRREAYFIGKTNVMSAGITIMAAFPCQCRCVTDDTVLLIHERRMMKTIQLDGPMAANGQILREQLALVESAAQVEKTTFADLSEGSTLSAAEILKRAKDNFYMTADEALELGLVASVIRSSDVVRAGGYP